MPFPNEHSARFKAPGDFKEGSFRRTLGGSIAGKSIPNTIGVISGELKNANGQRAIQFLRFPVKSFSVSEARRVASQLGTKVALFEPALSKVTKVSNVERIIKAWRETNFQFLESSRYKMNEDVDELLKHGNEIIKSAKGKDITFKTSNKFFKSISKPFHREEDKKKPKKRSAGDVLKQITGNTSEDAGHTHTFDINAQGNGKTSDDAGHTHEIKNFKVEDATGTAGIEHDHDLILNEKRKKKGVVKCYMEVINKGEDGIDLAYALDSARPRTSENFAVGVTINPETFGLVESHELKEGDTVLVKCGNIEALEVSGKWGVNLINPISAEVVMEKRKPNTTKEILKRAMEEDALQVDEVTLEKLQELKLVKPLEKKSGNDDNEGNIHKELPLIKVDEKQLVYGVVYEPRKVDSQGDYSTAEEIEKAAHKFLKDFNSISLMHRKKIDRSAKVVESYIAPKDFQMGGQTIRKGSWVMVTHVLDKNLWKLVKSGELNAYSIEGTGLPGPPIPELERKV